MKVLCVCGGGGGEGGFTAFMDKWTNLKGSHAGQPRHMEGVESLPCCFVQRHGLHQCFQRQAILAVVELGQEG